MTDSNFIIKKGLDVFDGDVSLKGSNKELRFYEGSNYVGFEAPALSADKIWVLPNADGATGQVLKTDGSGNLGWASSSGDVSKVGTPVNDQIGVWTGDGTLEGTSKFTFNSSNTLTIGGGAVYPRITLAGNNGFVYFKDNSSSNPAYQAAVGVNGAQFQIRVGSANNVALGIHPSGGFALGTSYGTAGQVLTTQGQNSPPTWTTISGSVGGSDTELLYNNGGTEDGIASLTWTDTAGSEQLLLSDASDTSLFKIIQTGTGDALEVHDEASDTTVFKVDQSGHVQIGTTSETIGALRVKGYQGTSSVSSVSTYRISRLEDGVSGSLEITSSQSDGDMYITAGSTGADLIIGTRRSSPSTANYENLRFTSNGEIGIEGSNFGTSGQVLTSGGAGNAASWTTVSSGDSNAGGVNGSTSAPTFAFTSDTDTGMYRISAGYLGFTSNAQLKLAVDPYGITVGDGNSAGYVNAKGTQDLILRTNNGTNSSQIKMVDGVNGDIDIDTNGTGSVRINYPTTNNSYSLLVKGNGNHATPFHAAVPTTSTNQIWTAGHFASLISSGSRTTGFGTQIEFRLGEVNYAGLVAGKIGAKMQDTGDSNFDMFITPQGTGNLALGNFTLDADQSVGLGQDNYVMTYDHSAGTIGLEAASGGIASVAADTSPQLGGDLDVNGNSIVSTSNANINITPNGTGIVDISTALEVGTGTYPLSNKGVVTIINDNADTYPSTLILMDNEDDATNGPVLTLYRNTASPFDNDILGKIQLSGEDSAGNPRVYGSIRQESPDVSDGSHDGTMFLNIAINGTQTDVVSVDGTGGYGGLTHTPSGIKTLGNVVSATSTANNAYITLLAVPHANFKAVKASIHITDSSSSEVQTMDVMCHYDGSAANFTEYGIIYDGAAPIGEIEVDINSSNIRIRFKNTQGATRTLAGSIHAVCHP